MDTLKSMTPEQTVVLRAAAVAPSAPFSHKAIVFKEGRLEGVAPDIEETWRLSRFHPERCEGLPMAHLVDVWRGRVDRGDSMLVLFFDADWFAIGGGVVNFEMLEDGRTVAGAALWTLREIDLLGLSAILETMAAIHGLDYALIWTTQEQPLAPGWEREAGSWGAIQSIRVSPLN
jgi:hypothetical protein